jgi:hypothetical protein
MSEYQGPTEEGERDQLIGWPSEHVPTYLELLEAVKAYKLWDVAEEKPLGTFHDRMDLCSYAQWAGDVALGRPHQAEWEGVPRLVLQIGKPT